MKIKIYVLLCVTQLFITSVWANEIQPNSEKKPDKPKVYNWFPVVFYTEETSLAVGVGTMYVLNKKQIKENSSDKNRFDSITAMAFYTLENQYSIQLAPEFYFDNEKYNIRTNINYSKTPSRFFGTGETVDKEADGEEYTVENKYFLGDFITSIVSRFRLGIRYNWHDYTVTDTETGDLLEQDIFIGQDGGTLSGAGIILDYDSRDNTFAASTGGFHQLIAMDYTDSMGSDFEFSQTTLDLRQYLSMGDKAVLAFQGVLQLSKGDVPFNRLVQLGGSSVLRGIYQGRYRDKNGVVLQAEYRYRFKPRWYATAFASAGEVANSRSELDGSNVKYSAGGGIRYALDPKNKLHLRLDIGVSEFGVSPVIVLGEAF